ncbi:MAG: helix-turn-helix domain-containing protein [Phycisphaerae bacterium]
MASRRKVFVMRRAEQLAALSGPIRWRIVEILSVHGPSSVRQLATRIHRKPESLYYHMRALVDVGLVVLDSTRKVTRRTEAVYRLMAPRLVVDRKQRSRPYKEALCRSCEAFLRLTARDHRSAVERGDFAMEGMLRNLMVRRHTARLTRDGLRQLNQLLDRVGNLLDEQDNEDLSNTYAVTIVLSQLAGGLHVDSRAERLMT